MRVVSARGLPATLHTSGQLAGQLPAGASERARQKDYRPRAIRPARSPALRQPEWTAKSLQTVEVSRAVSLPRYRSSPAPLRRGSM